MNELKPKELPAAFRKQVLPMRIHARLQGPPPVVKEPPLQLRLQLRLRLKLRVQLRLSLRVKMGIWPQRRRAISMDMHNYSQPWARVC